MDVVALFGPTASGKSAVAEVLADVLGTEIVSADAMQVYRGVPILTNQPTRPTRLVAIRDLDERMSLAEYARLAHTAIDEIVAHHGVAVVAGGTGLYLRAALAELDVPPTAPAGTRARLERLYDELGPEQAHAVLVERDPAAAAAVHPNDRRRVVRAMELAELGASLAPAASALWTRTYRRPTLLVGVDLDPARLERRIEARARMMLAQGAAAEARAAIARASKTSRHVIGLEELASGEAEGEAAIAAIVARTRRYAAYQRKWLRRLAPPLVLDGCDPPEVSAQRVLAALAAGTA